MEKKFRLLLLLALLLTAATGAWATPNSIVINGTPQVGDKSISLTYNFDPANVTNYNYGYLPTLKVKCAADNKWDEVNLPNEASSDTKTITLTKLGEFEAGKTYEVCFAYNNGGWVDDVFHTFVPAAAGPTTYKVTMKSGVKDADKWTVKVGEGQAQALPIGGLKGDGSETVTLQYNGRLKVKGVKATSDAAPAVKPAATVTTAPTAKTGVKAGEDVAIVNAGAATGGTMMYKVTTANTKPTSTEGFSATVPTAKTLAAGTFYVWYYVKADDSHTDSEISATAIAVTIAAATITVTINQSDFGWNDSFTKDGVTVSATMIDPNEGNLGGGGTFSTTLGNFTKIVVTCKGCDASGTGWSGNMSSMTWAGTPASTVNFSGYFMGMGMGITIVCTIVPTN